MEPQHEQTFSPCFRFGNARSWDCGQTSQGTPDEGKGKLHLSVPGCSKNAVLREANKKQRLESLVPENMAMESYGGSHSQPTADIGLIGLAVMGENLVLNMESHGFTVAVYNRTTAKVDEFISGRGKGNKRLQHDARRQKIRRVQECARPLQEFKNSSQSYDHGPRWRRC